ncbi:GNAT family N-acetyltransferase [Parasporobacterium paucivorans]|nr:GNAT family N-acetyltransferase [Parasporobacterium paucivorans]
MNEIKKGTNKFYMEDDKNEMTAEICFIPEKNCLVVNHTYVDRSLRGKGVGKQLVDKVACYARDERKKIIPVCSYAKKVMTEEEKYRDLIEDQDYDKRY